MNPIMKKHLDCYNKLITEYPDNIWGYLRMAELICDHSPEQALKFFKKASEIVPSYYGTWFRIAQIQYFNRKYIRSKISNQKSYQT